MIIKVYYLLKDRIETIQNIIPKKLTDIKHSSILCLPTAILIVRSLNFLRCGHS